ncbi:MBL fold metallo-hydrolase [Gaetbulibacter aquiaggeris]|uniref:MBL fold metallo-hydrolase n=1 Tax=Gaetbulibacter aquiaggeris TaxID=1735373 RepID=A0ABW7MVF2_9FLAO
MRVFFYFLTLSFLLVSCDSKKYKKASKHSNQYITVLGVAQDAGFPHINCDKDCCRAFYEGFESKKLIVSLGLVDLKDNKKYIFDATPDFTQQIQILKSNHLDNGNVIDGVFLTHGHIGHYTGLMYFGKEAMSAKDIPVYVMPRMKHYLETNGPWSQLVTMKNIELKPLHNDSTINLNKDLKITPFLVPHRDEYSETVGYKIQGKLKSALFIPDINKWYLLERSIVDEVKKVDYAFIDASFFKDGEISRPMKEIPHPFIVETVKLFEKESLETKSKIYFIHLNHTNPALKEKSTLNDSIQNLGFHFAKEGADFSLD